MGAALAAAAAATRLPRLGFPREEVFDEVYHAKTALQYLNGQTPVEWVHPPTAKLLIAVPVWLFGYHSWAWRLAPALAGIALAPVFYALARRVLPTPRAAVIASVLLLSDGVYEVQSRTAMTNIFAVLFQVMAALFVLRAVREERMPVLGMSLAGLSLGLAVSTRWTSLWAWGFLGLVLLVARRTRVFRPRELGLTALAFGLIPLVLYVLSYAPLMHQRHTLEDFSDVKVIASDLVQEQVNVWGYHAHLRADHPYFTNWYTWPWLYRPTWYFYNDRDGWVRGIVAIGNPALWWLSLPVCVWVLARGLAARHWGRVFAGAGYFFLYLPWGLSPRQLNYSHYLFEAIPYACLALGFVLDRHWDAPRARWAARGYVALVVLLFVYFFPLLTALPVPTELFYRQLWPGGPRPWTWFVTWV